MPRPYDAPALFCCSLCNSNYKFNCGLCMNGLCCPCIVYGRNRYRNAKGNDNGFAKCNVHCMSWCGLCLLGHWGWILQCLTRADMQERHNLNGDGCSNCMLSCCCPCCEVIQTSEELDFIKMMQDVESSNTAQNGYKAQDNMIAEPQSNMIVEPHSNIIVEAPGH